MRSVFFYTGIILSLILSMPVVLLVKFYEKTDKLEKRDALVYNLTTKWAKYVMWLSGAKITVNGKENIPKNETVLFVGNHQSNFDIPLVMSQLEKPKGFIAKKELESWPFISTWMKQIKCVFMDRKNIRKSAEAIVEGINLLKGGYSMVIFPEGTRSKGGPMLEFKGGSFKLALKSKVSIVPFTIDGSWKLLEKNNNWVKSAPVTITIHEAISTKDLTKEEIAELPEKVQGIIQSKLPK